jgi:uncharacterized protein (DUF362 family)
MQSDVNNDFDLNLNRQGGIILLNRTLKRRDLLKSLLWSTIGAITGGHFVSTDRALAQSSGPLYLPLIYGSVRSHVYGVQNVPVPNFASSDYHQGVDGLLTLMGKRGRKFYQHSVENALSGPEGIIAANDVVLLKVNAQWKHRGCTNTDVVRGLIQRVLDHPGGFTGEIVIFENGQGRGSFDSDQEYDGDTSVAANAEDQSHTFNYLVNVLFQGQPVTNYLLDPVRSVSVGENDHTTNGYRAINPHPERQSWNISYPCFTTAGGNRLELGKGLWTGSDYSPNLKLINMPVLKTHSGCGVTGALKLFYGVLSMQYAASGYHYNTIGQVLGQMFAHVRAPNLNIMDAIWVSHSSLGGWPPDTTSRQNTLLASIDPVALDYWASKYILYPVSNNPNHHPDQPDQYTDSNLSDYLDAAVMEINTCAPICGHPVTRSESEIICHWV